MLHRRNGFDAGADGGGLNRHYHYPMHAQRRASQCVGKDAQLALAVDLTRPWTEAWRGLEGWSWAKAIESRNCSEVELHRRRARQAQQSGKQALTLRVRARSGSRGRQDRDMVGQPPAGSWLPRSLALAPAQTPSLAVLGLVSAQGSAGEAKRSVQGRGEGRRGDRRAMRCARCDMRVSLAVEQQGGKVQSEQIQTQANRGGEVGRSRAKVSHASSLKNGTGVGGQTQKAMRRPVRTWVGPTAAVPNESRGFFLHKHFHRRALRLWQSGPVRLLVLLALVSDAVAVSRPSFLCANHVRYEAMYEHKSLHLSISATDSLQTLHTSFSLRGGCRQTLRSADQPPDVSSLHTLPRFSEVFPPTSQLQNPQSRRTRNHHILELCDECTVAHVPSAVIIKVILLPSASTSASTALLRLARAAAERP